MQMTACPAAETLVLSPASLCLGILLELSRGARQIGQAALDSDRNQLAFCIVLFALCLFAALHPSWPGSSGSLVAQRPGLRRAGIHGSLLESVRLSALNERLTAYHDSILRQRFRAVLSE